jgi:hypothetical protein
VPDRVAAARRWLRSPTAPSGSPWPRPVWPRAPHAAHIHFGADARHECPTATDDADADARLSTTEGGPAYGPIVVSLTKTGDTSPESGLAVDRFAAGAGFQYMRGDVAVAPEIATAIESGQGVVVVHGVAYEAARPTSRATSTRRCPPPRPTRRSAASCPPLRPVGRPPAAAARRVARRTLRCSPWAVRLRSPPPKPARSPPGTGRIEAQTLSHSRPLTLTIPSLGVDRSPLVELGKELGKEPDGSLEVPSDYDQAGWFAPGPAPGQFGPAVLAGHVDSKAGPAVFYRLAELRPAAIIDVARADGRVARFAVDKVERDAKDRSPPSPSTATPPTAPSCA